MISYKHFLVCILIISTFSINAQETFYYKQIKVVRDNITIKEGTGGQFISFYKDICYESDIHGESVGHGFLDEIKKSDGEFTQYQGPSYWGTVIFKFNKSLNRLNVIKTDGTIYVYQRRTPPKNQKTSSLIRKSNSESRKAVPNSQPYNNYSNYDNYYNAPSINNNNNYNTKEKTKVRKQCAYCSGKGERIQHEYATNFGTNGPRVYCNICNQSWNYGTIHTHHRCNHCNGTGYIEYEY